MTAWPEWLAPLFLAPFVGSFLGVLIRRLPRGEPVALSRSRCEACGRNLGALDLVPLVSHAALRGRCRGCAAPIPSFHWKVELAALGVALWVVLGAVLAPGDAGPGRLWADLALGWTLLALAWIDLEHGRLPDVLTLPLVVGGLGATLALEPWALTDHAIGAVLGYAAFRLVALAYRAWRGREGLGGGDAKLLAAAGAWVGWQGLDAVVVIAALAGLATALVRRRPGEPLGATTSLPFGPGLAFGLLLVRLHGGALTG
ncbi:prepilin peptidase [Pararoseomonas indoligenes]|uniref:Prepilin leader peptidase/N-methyltransferase n=1 Tax=Roseomonas indoligenes TaxID=2820811 RepID=A0A940MZB5_9PROT|nr:A24 family peptidase [Pararoseomonas indoligenes]MBP0494946.1 prepilin peptidase [Pararoseomonas indoligenes]